MDIYSCRIIPLVSGTATVFVKPVHYRAIQHKLQLSHKTHDGNISVRFHTICWQGLQRVKLRLRNNYPSPTMISITKRSPVRGRLNIRYSTANVEAHYNIPFCLRYTQALSVKFCSNRE